MIKGTKFFNDRSRFWVQTNNGEENILKKALPAGPDGIHHGWLEDCGPTSAVNVLDALGRPVACMSPGGANLRPMDFLTMWMGTPDNWPAEQAVAPGIDPSAYQDNEIAQFYPVAVQAVFGAPIEYHEGQTFDWLASLVQGGKGAMICLINPGHFLAVLAYDDQTQELIYNDPWPGRTGTDGFNLRMGRDEFGTNVKPYTILFS